MKSKIITQTKKLALMLGMGGLTGTVAIAALAGLFRLDNVGSLAFGFMAGPGAITTALLLDGSVKERIIAAVLAGIMATLIVVLAAGFGPKLLGLMNINVLRIVGGIAVFAIALLIAGVKIPENLPLFIIIAGIIIAVIWR